MNLAYLLDPVFQIEGVNGKPVVNGYVEVYLAGTDVRYVTYQSFDGVKNPFKVPLSTDGRATILADQTQHYDVYVYDALSNLVCSRKNVSCVGYVNVVSKDNVQVVTYGVTKWSDIDFTKSLLLRYTSHDTVVTTATYTADDTSLKFYAYIDGEVYVVQLLHDTDEWSSTVLDTSETYIAVYGATTLAELNALSTDVLVYMKQDDSVYMNSYRSPTEWRFTQVDGDMVHEASLTSAGWTEESYSLGGSYTAGYGLKLTQHEFDVDTDVIQKKLTAGNHILINDANVISTIPDSTKLDSNGSNATAICLGKLLNTATSPVQVSDVFQVSLLSKIDTVPYYITLQQMFNYIYGKIGIDATPTKGSSNLVSSGGVYTAIAPLTSAAFSCVNFNITPAYQTANVFDVKSKAGTLLFQVAMVLGQSNLIMNMLSPINTWRVATEDHVGTTLATDSFQVNSGTASRTLVNVNWAETHNLNIQMCQGDKRLDINLYHYSNYESYSLQIVSNTYITEQST